MSVISCFLSGISYIILLISEQLVTILDVDRQMFQRISSESGSKGG